MRFRSLGRLACGLVSFLALHFAPAPASAQDILTECGVGGIEGVIDVNGEALNLVVSDALTGSKLWPAAAGAFLIEESNGEEPFDADLVLDTNVPGVTVAEIRYNRLYLPRGFYVLTFSPYVPSEGEPPPTFTDVVHIAWQGSGWFGPDGTPTPAPYAFYDPAPVERNVDTCFRRVGGEVYVSTEDVGAATTIDGFINDALGSSGWTVPYDALASCIAPCPSMGTSNSDLRPGQFVSYRAQVQEQPGGGYRLIPDFRMATSVRLLTAYPAQTWDVPGLTLRFAPGTSLVAEGTLNASGVTLTASDAAVGWGGVRFNAGSGGAWTNNTTVERVAGGATAFPGFGPTVNAFVGVEDASPTFTDVTLRFPVGAVTVDGFYVTETAKPVNPVVITTPIVTGMTGSGLVVNGGARVDLFRGDISGADGAAVVAGGAGATAYLRRAVTGDFRGPQLTGNAGGGAVAGSGAVVRFGTDSPTAPGYGYASVRNNPGRGLTATGGGDVYAGSGTVAAGAYQRNQIYDNGGTSPTGNALATGTGSTVYARCNWWGQNATAPFNTGQASGGLVDASYYLTQNPYDVATPSCVPASQIDPGRGLAGGGRRHAEGVAGRGTPEAEASALDRLAEAMAAGSAAEAVGLLAALVAEMPETEAAAAALGEAGVVAGRADAPGSAVALLGAATQSEHGPLRVAAWQATVSVRRAQGDHVGALAAADALAAEGGPALVQAETARVYLHGEGGDEAQALTALESLEALAPGSVELDLARAFLGLEAPVGGRGVSAPAVEACGSAPTGAAAPDVVTLVVGPNPAATVSAVTLTLREAGEATVTVYDLLGRAVAVPLTGALAAGTHRAFIDGSALAPGVYVVRASVNTGAGAVVRSTRLTVTR